MSYGISDIPYLRRDFALSSSKSRWATGIVLSAGLDTNFSRFSKLLGLERAAVVEILFGLLKSPYVFWSALTDVIRLSANTLALVRPCIALYVRYMVSFGTSAEKSSATRILPSL